ncbi:MAG: hypothetical protein IT383_19905 [Deltaproteobacteria bacterium]|nr:hypothetical protein [Deltaproteobacteria bacterium]
MPSIVKSVRVSSPLDARLKGILADSRGDQRTQRRPMKEAEALGLALDIGTQELERRTVGWKWRCDNETCRSPIQSVRDGMLEWVELEGGHHRDLRLVHAGQQPSSPTQRCSRDPRAERAKDDGILASRTLADMVGPEGFLLMDDLARKRWQNSGPVERMCQRLCVPGFEQVFRSQAEAMRTNAYRPLTAFPAGLRLTEIEDIARWMASSQDGTKREDGLVALHILGKSGDAMDGDEE